MNWLTKVKSLFSKKEEEKETNTQDLSSMKLAELRAVAKDRGLKRVSGLRKAQLLERLQED